ncbi:MAG: type II toxin-antitoxin system VapC family toxin [Candidatus Marinimicrobia bacterium]|nr:type II toxin-antitoxin system VapC family toxin [Candidatus Neomarinimicrobiota bacterium]
MVYVVDASVAAKWFVEEAFSDEASRLLDEPHELHAPDFLLVEFDNVLVKRIRRKEMSVYEGDQIRDAIRLFPIRLHPFRTLLRASFEIANQTKRSLYDCLYLTLAISLEAEMVTADFRFYQEIRKGPLMDYQRWVEDLP